MNTFLKALSLLAVISSTGFAADNDTAQQEPAAQPFVYLKCPSTSLELDSKSLMHNDGGFYSISYDVKPTERAKVTESCSFVVTDSEGFAANTSIYVADVKADESVAPGLYYGLVAKTPAANSPEQLPSFSIHYDFTGPYAVYLNLEELEFFVTPLLFAP